MFCIKRPILIITFLFIVISVIYIQINKDTTIYLDNQELSGIATITSDMIEKEYNYVYKIRFKKHNYLMYIKKQKGIKPKIYKYGDVMEFKGVFKEPSVQRNYNGFNYKMYLRSQDIYGIIKTTTNNVWAATQLGLPQIYKPNILFVLGNMVKNSFSNKINKLLPEKTANLFLGILLGDTSKLDMEIKEYFKESSLSHMLAVSGAHIAYIILRMYSYIKKVKNK